MGSRNNKIEVLDAYWSTEPKRRKIKGFGWFGIKSWIIFDSDGVLTVVTSDGVIYFDALTGFICDSTSLLWADDIAGDGHDFGYGIQGAKHGYTRKFWDDVYLHLNLYQFGKFKAYRRYWGVRLFGRRAYKKRRLEKYEALRFVALRETIIKLGV